MLPLRTSIEPRRTPYVNYMLIAVNIIVFLISFSHQTGQGTVLSNWTSAFLLTPDRPYLWQFVTYAFLHSNMMHIFGNMFFLYIFGNNVNDKLGHTGYLCFYLAGAVFSGIGHSLIDATPVLGASGAVAAVTGAYLVLFPNSLITVVYWFFFIGTLEIRALYFIALKLIILDNIIAADASHGIAYTAHLAGYGFGVVSVIGLLAAGLIESNFNDLWSMLRQWNRRRQFRDVVAEGDDPFKGTQRKTIFSKMTGQAKPDSEKEKQLLALRSRIGDAMNNRNPGQAAELYLKLLELDKSQTLPRQLQLDIANQLMSEGKWQPSAEAYEKFLVLYQNYEYAEQVHLMLGLLYSRYLNKPQEAVANLQKAIDRLSDPGQKAMCRQEIERLKQA